MGFLLFIAACTGQSDAPRGRAVDCGTAAMYCFRRYQGANTSFVEVRRVLEQFGAPPYSMSDLRRALADLGARVVAVRTTGDDLPDRTPFIAYLKTTRGGHFMACQFDRRADRAEFVDTRGAWTGRPSDLHQMPGWTGVILIPRPYRWLDFVFVLVGIGLGITGAASLRIRCLPIKTVVQQ